MVHATFVLGWCLLAQAGETGQFEPIRVPARQAAPPADLGAPEDSAAAPSEDMAPAGDEPAPPAADAPLDLHDRYRATDDPAVGHEPPAEEPTGDLEALGSRPRQRLRPPELIAEALENPSEAALDGAPLSLTQALARTPDRQQQLAITQSYWRLAAAQADYHWAVQQRESLGELTRSYADSPGVLSALAAAAADVGEARLAVDEAQQELLGRLGSAAGKPPLAIDRPHVGDYRTHYDSIFAGRAPPPRINLIHRTLPVRRKAIDAHAEAVVAAADAVEAAGEQFAASGQGLTTLLGAAELLAQERRAFIAQVRDYNLDIADYAFAVAPANLRSDTLVSMLIRTSPAGAGPNPARSASPDPSIQKTFRNGPPGKRTSSADPDDWTSNYAGDLDARAADDPAVYQGLLAVTNKPLRVQKLANLLHWDRSLPPEAGQPLSLAECLRAAPVQNRAAAIDAFWRARETAARLQLFNDVQERLDALQAIAIPLRGEPGMAEAGVRLQAARRAARAATWDAQLELLAAQFDLMQAVGRPSDDSWFLPASAPQSGRYLVSERGRASRGAHWAERMAGQYDKLGNRADAVIQCDAERAELVQLARSNQTGENARDGQLTPLDRVVWAVRRQNEQTLAFLSDLTGYNRAIANYVLATQPASLSGDDLAGKLAVERSTLRDS